MIYRNGSQLVKMNEVWKNVNVSLKKKIMLYAVEIIFKNNVICAADSCSLSDVREVTIINLSN